MAINTGLSVPVFNLIKYLALFVSFDIIARLSIDKLKSYNRSHRLAHGYSVPISSNPIDRHGLTSTSLTSVSFLQCFAVLLILGTYAIEVMLEFSSDSVPILTNVPGEMRVLPADESTCAIGGTIRSGVVEHMINFANECIVLDEEKKNYSMYRANWQVTSTSVFPNCSKTEANTLTKGRMPFDETDWINDQPTGQSDEFQAFDQGPDSLQSVFTFNVTSEDVYLRRRSDWSEDHIGGVYRALLPSSKGTCHGTLVGKKGEKLTKLENRVCTRSNSWPIPNDTDLIFISGTAVAFSDIAQLEKTPWSTSIIAKSFFGVHGIRNFSRIGGSRQVLSAHAFMMFLGRTHNRDRRSLQQYAIVYQNCELVQVPSIRAKPKLETVPNAASELIVRAEVQGWALILVASWSLFLIIIRVVVGYAIRRQSLPYSVRGERDMAKLWFSDKVKGHTFDDTVSEGSYDLGSNTKANDDAWPMSGSARKRRWWNVFGKVVQARFYLSVKEGSETDDVTVTKSARKVERDTAKRFSSLH